MKNIIIALLFDLCLIGCAFSGTALPSMKNMQSKKRDGSQISRQIVEKKAH